MRTTDKREYDTESGRGEDSRQVKTKEQKRRERVKEMRETETEKRKLKNTKKERQDGGNIDRRKEKGG